MFSLSETSLSRKCWWEACSLSISILLSHSRKLPPHPNEYWNFSDFLIYLLPSLLNGKEASGSNVSAQPNNIAVLICSWWYCRFQFKMALPFLRAEHWSLKLRGTQLLPGPLTTASPLHGRETTFFLALYCFPRIPHNVCHMKRVQWKCIKYLNGQS